MSLLELLSQLLISLLTVRGLSVLRRVEATDRDAEDIGHDGDGVFGLVGGHESEGFLGSFPLQLANQAAAFSKNSRSS